MKAGIGALLLLLLCAGTGRGQTARRIRFADLPPGWEESESSLESTLRDLEQRTRERFREGESDHLVAYLLQSKQFTAEPAIEPALSAWEYLGDGRREAMLPAGVERRADDFLRASPGKDPRLAYFQKLAGSGGKDFLRSAYDRCMRFLLEKEQRQERGQAPADLYRERGLSVDTQVEAGFAVWTGLAVQQSLQPEWRADRVLIVGPGLDLAPRTGMLELFPPQSYQPFAVADALLSLGLARRDRLRIHCLDIHPLVVDFFGGFSKRSEPLLHLVSGLRREQLSSDFEEYFRRLGGSIGREQSLRLPPPLAGHLGKALRIENDVARGVTADRINILTGRLDPSPGYDLAVATNILVYFDARELRLALANIGSMLRPGGILLHNEVRPEIDAIAAALGLIPVQGRVVRLSPEAGSGKPLLDSFVLHRRR